MSFSSDKPALESQIPVSIEFPKEPEALRNMLYSNHQRIASSLNGKIGGLYVPIEKTTGALYFKTSNTQKNRVVYRMVVDFGALPNTATKSVAHSISGWDANFRLVQSYGGATDPIAFESVPIPNEGIFLKINSTNVIIITTADYSAFTECTVVVEYTKEG